VRTRQFLDSTWLAWLPRWGVFVPFVHLVPYAIDHGISATAAAWLLGAIGIGSTIGRFFLGSIADKIGRERFLAGMYLGMAASLAIWTISGALVLLVVFALVFGLFYGGWVAILPAVVADRFGARSVGAIIGVLYTNVAIGTLIGPSGAGFIYDLSHRYVVPIAASAAANAVAAALTIMAVRRASASQTAR
jgi:OFA family oxalate/formate antiporter-like MFS transporter